MTDTQADLTERARAVILRHVRLAPNAYVRNPKTNDMTLDLASVDEAARELAAIAQSERDVAAAEARRAALEEAALLILDCNTLRGDKLADILATGIRALASPTPQEER